MGTDEASKPPGEDPEATGDPPEAERVAVLVELRGDFRPVHGLDEHNVLGRSPECTVWIMDPLASRRHAEINLTSDGTYELADLDSTFGTFLNKRKIDRAPLAEGDELFLGATQLRFETRPPDEVNVRRHQNRLHCEMSARLTVGDQTVETRATDLSLGGVRVDWGEALELGTALELELDVPDRAAPLRQRCEASHWSDDSGLGVRFLFADEAEEKQMAEAYAQLFLAAGPDRG